MTQGSKKKSHLANKKTSYSTSIENSLETVKLTPQVRDSAIEETPEFNPIDRKAIQYFLPKNRVVNIQVVASAALTGSPTKPTYVASKDDFIYVDNYFGPQNIELEVFRPKATFVNTENGSTERKASAADSFQELEYIGLVVIDKVDPKQSGRALAKVLSAPQELLKGLILLPKEITEGFSSFYPKSFNNDLPVTIIGLDGLSGLKGSIVLLDKGSADGVELGHIFSVLRGKKEDAWAEIKEGNLIVVKTFDHFAYALVLSSPNPIVLGDELVSPDKN
jgi:hypothetical protein